MTPRESTLSGTAPRTCSPKLFVNFIRGVKFGIGRQSKMAFTMTSILARIKITSDDFAKIEAKMTELARRDEQIVRADISIVDALEALSATVAKNISANLYPNLKTAASPPIP